MTSTPDQRLLLVHAHPDDESIGNGATMARYVAEGRGVTLVTCTAGEMGEVLVPDLAHLAAERDGGLEHQRRQELEQAMKELGVTDYRFLGGFGDFRDSGMKWHADGHAIAADDTDEAAFANADLTDAATLVVEVIREVRPQVLVTYDEFGGYGHPDHIQAHRVAMYAATLAAVPSFRRDLGEAWEITKIYWGAMSESRMRAGLRRLREAGDTTSFEGMDPDGPLPRFAVSDADLTAAVDGGTFVENKMAALRAHATQITSTDRSSPCPTTWATRCGRPSSTGSPRARPPPTGSRRTCSPGCEGTGVRRPGAALPAGRRGLRAGRGGRAPRTVGLGPGRWAPPWSRPWRCRHLVGPAGVLRAGRRPWCGSPSRAPRATTSSARTAGLRAARGVS